MPTRQKTASGEIRERQESGHQRRAGQKDHDDRDRLDVVSVVELCAAREADAPANRRIEP